MNARLVRNNKCHAKLGHVAKWLVLIGAVLVANLKDPRLMADESLKRHIGPVSASIKSAQPVALEEERVMAAEAPTVDEGGFYMPSAYDWNAPMSADCGMGCPATWRIRGEYLAYTREGESNVTLSNGFQGRDFDYERGGRVSIGRKFDCTIGWEVTYMGGLDWIETQTATGPGTLNTRLGGNGVNLSAFNGADLHQQTYQSELDSVEAVQKWWGWDVLTTSAGIRYVEVDELLALRSTDANGDIGLFSIQTQNRLIGGQLGLEMLFPVGKLSFDSGIKGALMANFGDATTRLVNAGAVQINNTPDDLEFAALVEGGSWVRFALTPRIIARAGYEYLWIYGIGVAADQLENPIGASTGRGFDGQGDTFYHGFAGGVEVIW